MLSESDSGINITTEETSVTAGASSTAITVSDEDDSEVFAIDYRKFLDDQVKKVVEAEKIAKTLTRADELDLSIDLCKRLLLEIGDRDERKAAIVMDIMVELRLEFAQLKENLSNGLSADAVVKFSGHKLVLQTSRGTNPYCEICVSTIWRLAQYWRRCAYCGLRTHDRCLSRIQSPCVSKIVNKSGFQFETDICKESSLFSQNFECYSCQASLAFDEGSALEPRLCDYTGNYYCKKCHWNDEMVIPARVFRNWDFSPRPVCRTTKKLLTYSLKRPIISIEKINPMLPQYVAGLNELCKLRKNLLFMKCYFTSCKWAKQLRILQYLNMHQHFVEGSDLFALDDLIQLAAGTLLADIKEIVTIFKRHITDECERCKGHAYVCELCSNKESLFPFSDTISICRDCHDIFHEACYFRVSKRCPRCARREKRRLRELVENDA